MIEKIKRYKRNEVVVYERNSVRDLLRQIHFKALCCPKSPRDFARLLQRAAEFDAKTLEYMLRAVHNSPGVAGAAGQVINARSQLRIVDANITSIEAKVKHSEAALSATVLREPDAYRVKTLEHYLNRLNLEKNRLELRRDHWQLQLDNSHSRSAELRTQHLVRRFEANTTESTSRQGNERAQQSGTKLNYSSALKRAIALLLTINPSASDLEICRQLDADGAIELPARWTTGNNREFELAYKSREHKHKVELTISKVRAEMRKKGLLARTATTFYLLSTLHQLSRR